MYVMLILIMRRPASKTEKKFAKKLKELRGDQSQVAFAKKIGIAQSTLNRLENLEQSVTLHLIEKIADRLKLDVRELID